uniref:Uncharacterized protein n=1 Tax=Meloidogyne enterolobii TaxID=390850 RepID=A0A6V7UPW6_MELEN|nr:unnamed protein product [Meloidogyne enterolobii]
MVANKSRQTWQIYANAWNKKKISKEERLQEKGKKIQKNKIFLFVLKN